MSRDLIILGAGGHGRVLADAVIKCGDTVAGFLDDSEESLMDDFDLLGKISDILKWKDTHEFLIGIGNNSVRKLMDQKYKVVWHTLIHPTASVARKTEIGAGTVVLANAVVNTGAQIGRHCIINSGAIVEHDNIIGDYTHLSPRVALGGTVEIGSNVHVGIGATVINGVHITDNCAVGAGAVVVKDITEPGVYVGVPAVKIK